SRAGALSNLGDVTSSVPPSRPARPGALAKPQLKSSPISDKGAFLPAWHRELWTDAAGATKGRDISGAIAGLQASLDQMERQQAATLSSIEEDYRSRARAIRGVLTELGIDAGKNAGGEQGSALGGPFVPPRVPTDANGFERQIYRTSIARVQVDRLARTLHRVPIRKPLEGEIDLASGYGVRQDPFSGAPAMHTGVDIHGETGEPVPAS